MHDERQERMDCCARPAACICANTAFIVQGELVRMATELETSLLAKTGREGAASPVVAASDDLQVWHLLLHATDKCQPHDQQLLACNAQVLWAGSPQ